MKKSQHLLLWLLVVLLIVGIALLAWQPVWEVFQHNLLALDLMYAALGKETGLGHVYARTAASLPEEPRANWFLGVLAGRLGNPSLQEAYWANYLDSSLPEALRLVHAGARENARLALHATRVYPAQAESWFWLADLLSQGKLDHQAITAYQRALQFDPSNGPGWCRLGTLLLGEDKEMALNAFINCCYSKDWSARGCYYAGYISEKLGDFTRAIHYYRLSKFPVAQRSAADLEARLAVGK
jgi:tetratricopeptide (TPR) repeat protein